MIRRESILTILSFMLTSITVMAGSDYTTLLMLCQKSDLIVLAEVGDDLEARFRGESTYRHRGDRIEVGVPLLIGKILKGKSDRDTVYCYISRDFSYSMPSYFTKGETLMAFLKESTYSGEYSPASYESGIKHINSHQMPSFEKSVVEIIEILEIPDLEKRGDKVAGWLFRSVTNSLTRYDAILTLDLPSYYTTDTTDYVHRLSKSQLRELYESALTAPNIWYWEVRLLEITQSVWDDRLLPALLVQLTKEYPGTVQNCIDIIQIMARIIGTDEARDLAEEDNRMEGNPLRWTNRKSIIERFIKLAEKSVP